MYFKICVLILLNFCIYYPLCFWLSNKRDMRDRFSRFHIGMINVISGSLLIALFFMGLSWRTIALAFLWKGVLFYFSRKSWRKSYPNKIPMTFTCVLGSLLLFAVLQDYGMATFVNFTTLILNGMIFSLCIFYLSLTYRHSPKYPVSILTFKYVLNCLITVLSVKIIGTLCLNYCLVQPAARVSCPVNLFSNGDIDFIFAAIVFGATTVFPLWACLGAKIVLKYDNILSSARIFHIIFISVLTGEIMAKYSLLTLGITF